LKILGKHTLVNSNDIKYSSKAIDGTGGPFTDEESAEWYNDTALRFCRLVKLENGKLSAPGFEKHELLIMKAIAYLNYSEDIKMQYDAAKPIKKGFFSSTIEEVEHSSLERIKGKICQSPFLK
jgi:hypothetical protein